MGGVPLCPRTVLQPWVAFLSDCPPAPGVLGSSPLSVALGDRSSRGLAGASMYVAVNVHVYAISLTQKNVHVAYITANNLLCDTEP